MSAVRIAGIAAAAVLAGATLSAQNNGAATSSTKNVKDTSATVVGCLMKETDYRKAHGLGKGALGGTGLGDEYVLVDASVVSPGASENGSGACSENAAGMAYRTTGHLEKDLKPFLGQRVEVTGHFQHAKDATMTSVDPGKLPPEIVVRSYHAPSAAAASNQVAEHSATPPAPAAETTRPTGTSGKLPKTAGEEPLIGLLGLLALGSGFSLRIRRAYN